MNGKLTCGLVKKLSNPDNG